MRAFIIVFLVTTSLIGSCDASVSLGKNQYPSLMYPYIIKRVASTVIILKSNSILANKDGLDGNGKHSIHPFGVKK